MRGQNIINQSHEPQQYCSLQQQQPSLSLIKSRQLLSTIMDTIQQKSTNNNQPSSLSQLKQSLQHFDKQLMKIYTCDNKGAKRNQMAERMTKKGQNNAHYYGAQWGRRMANRNASGNNRNNYDAKSSTFRQREDVNYHRRPMSAQRDDPNNNYNNTNNKSIKMMNKHNNSSQSTRKLLVPSSSVHKLQVPQPNSLTDQFLQKVLGSQQGLIGQYDRCVNPQKYEYERKQQMIERIKNQWRNGGNNSSSFNNNNNYNNNTSIWMMRTVFTSQDSSHNYDYNNNPSLKKNIINNPHFIGQQFTNKGGAFYDEQHYNYLKTNMKYIAEIGQQRKEGNNSNNINNNNIKKVMHQFKKSVGNSLHNSNVINRNSYDNQTIDSNDTGDTNNISHYNYSNNTLSSPYNNPNRIVAKIKQTGGIQNTIKKMEKSLKKNQLKHLKSNQYLTHKSNLIPTIESISMQQPTTTPGKSSEFHNNPQNIINNKLQSPQYSHNYNQSSTTIKKQKIKKTDIHIPEYKNTQFPLSYISTPRNRPSWRDRSKSMRNKIEKSIDNNK